MSNPLPKNWVEVPIGEIAHINPPLDRCLLDENTEITFLCMSSVLPEHRGISEPGLRPYREVSKGYTRFVEGDVLVAKITPCMENGKVVVAAPLTNTIGCGSTEFHVFRPRPGIDPGWISRFLWRSDIRHLAKTHMTGAVGQQRVPTGFFEDLTIPVPSTSEQRRIIPVLDDTLAKIDEAEEALDRVRRNLDRYRASVLKAACEGRLVPTEAELARQENRDYEPASQLLKRILIARREAWEKAQLEAYAKKGKTPQKDWKSRYPEPQTPDISDLPELPEGWCWVSVDQMVNFVGTGATPERGNPRYWTGGTIAWVTSSCVNSETVTEAYEFITEAAIAETNAKTFEPGTLLLAMYGEGKTRGKVTELRICAATNQACASLVFGTSNQLLSGYLKLYLKNNYESMRRLASGGVQPNLNISMIRSLVVPMPPFHEQLRIVTEESRIASFLHELTISLGANSKACHTLRQSLLKHAFSGKLVPHDPADEPASVLLERIRAQRLELKGGTTPRKRAVRKTKKSS